MSRPRGESKLERKVRETVSIPRPGTAGTATAPSLGGGYSLAPSSVPTKAPSAPAQTDDYDDDFEAYDDDDDFEEDDDSTPAVAQAKPAAKAVPSMKPGPGSHYNEPAPVKGSGGGARGAGRDGNEMAELRLSMQNENIAAMEARKHAAKSESPDERQGHSAVYSRQLKSAAHVPTSSSADAHPQATFSSRRAKRFSSMEIQDDGFAFGPKEARLKQLRDSNVIEMRVDTFSNFNLAPTTKFDTYQRQLRGKSLAVALLVFVCSK